MKKLLALVLTVLMVLSLAACGSDEKGDSKESGKNTYETPLDLWVAVSNEKDASKMLDRELANLNGFCEEECLAAWKIIEKSSEYYKDEELEYYQDLIDGRKDVYGSDYKLSYKIVEKEKLDEYDLEEFAYELKDFAEEIEREIVDYVDGFDADDWEEYADDVGVSVSNAKELVEIAEKLYKALQNAEVEEGYKLTVDTTIKGSELDEPDRFEQTLYVYKIDGRWVSDIAFDVIEEILSYL